jgi:hypothetical protein
MKQKIPENIKILLWDIRKDQILLGEHYQFIIERIMEYGDVGDIKWMESTFSKDKIIKTLKRSKRLSAKTANYFAIKYKISKSEIQCMIKPYTKKQERF